MSQTSGPVAAFVEATLHVRPGEGRRTALLFTHLLLASAVFILGRTVRDTLFLSRYPLRALPWMFVLYGLASAVTVIAYARVADRFPRHRVIVASTGSTHWPSAFFTGFAKIPSVSKWTRLRLISHAWR